MPSRPEAQAAGWESSAWAWIAEQGEEGDWGRRAVLDAPMVARVTAGGFRDALDVGCGEGRFCRKLTGMGLRTIGVDPTEGLLARARALHPGGDYRAGTAEALPVAPGGFDLVVSYLSLIDIAPFEAALAGMAAALKPGGALLIANLNPFFTAAAPENWRKGADGRPVFAIDRYGEARAVRASWRGIDVVNHHRPLSAYMGVLLGLGLRLRYFAEPEPLGQAAEADPARTERYRRVPWFHAMEWGKD